MEITGTIKSKHADQIRLITFDKNQELDIFYTESKKYDVEELSVNQQIIVEVRIQTVDYYSLKMGKFWLSRIISPVKRIEHKERGKGTSDRDWSKSRKPSPLGG